MRRPYQYQKKNSAVGFADFRFAPIRAEFFLGPLALRGEGVLNFKIQEVPKN